MMISNYNYEIIENYGPNFLYFQFLIRSSQKKLKKKIVNIFQTALVKHTLFF